MSLVISQAYLLDVFLTGDNISKAAACLYVREIDQFQSWKDNVHSLQKQMEVKLEFHWTGNLSVINLHKHLGKGADNQNGNLRWHLPLGGRPPPLNGTNFQTLFYPTFFFCNWLLHRWNRFYTWSQSKISLLSPLWIDSKLTFISSSGRWLPTI